MPLLGDGAAQALEHAGEEVVLEAVVERDIGRRADDHDRSVGIQPELLEHLGGRLEVRQVVLLLEPLVGTQLAVRAVAVQALGRDRVGDDHGGCEPAVDVVLDGGPLVVEHRRARYSQQRRCHAHVVGAVTEGDVEASAGGGSRIGPGPAHQRRRARREPTSLGRKPSAAMAADRGVGDLEALAQLDRLREVTGGNAHVVAGQLQPLDHRPHHQHVRAVGQVDPYAHLRPR